MRPSHFQIREQNHVRPRRHTRSAVRVGHLRNSVDAKDLSYPLHCQLTGLGSWHERGNDIP